MMWMELICVLMRSPRSLSYMGDVHRLTKGEQNAAGFVESFNILRPNATKNTTLEGCNMGNVATESQIKYTKIKICYNSYH